MKKKIIILIVSLVIVISSFFLLPRSKEKSMEGFLKTLYHFDLSMKEDVDLFQDYMYRFSGKQDTGYKTVFEMPEVKALGDKITKEIKKYAVSQAVNEYKMYHINIYSTSFYDSIVEGEVKTITFDEKTPLRYEYKVTVSYTYKDGRVEECDYRGTLTLTKKLNKYYVKDIEIDY